MPTTGSLKSSRTSCSAGPQRCTTTASWHMGIHCGHAANSSNTKSAPEASEGDRHSTSWTAATWSPVSASMTTLVSGLGQPRSVRTQQPAWPGVLQSRHAFRPRVGWTRASLAAAVASHAASLIALQSRLRVSGFEASARGRPSSAASSGRLEKEPSEPGGVRNALDATRSSRPRRRQQQQRRQGHQRQGHQRLRGMARLPHSPQRGPWA
mmetsp:Transcript_28690/g.82440  ORF Transcript_28690/g.82440 Transcript_28690/m.82440 type:complete len:210 (+) Transcript_28690:300-929(+)